MCKSISTCIQSLLIATTLLHFAQVAQTQVPQYSVFFKCLNKGNKRALDTFAISYDKNLPFPGQEHKSFIVSKKAWNKVHAIRVASLRLQFNYEHVYVEPGDTISYVIKEDNKTAIVYHDKSLQDYRNTQRQLFEKGYAHPSEYRKNAPSLSDYFAYCKQYRQEEQMFIDSLFGKRKPVLKAHLQEFGDYAYLYNLFTGMKTMPVGSEDSLAFVSVATQSRNIDNPTTGYFNNYWRIFVGNLAEVLGGGIEQPLDPLKFNRMIAAAKAYYSPATYRKYLLWSLHRISNIAVPAYELTAKSIHAELSKMNLTTQERLLIDKKYKEILVMSKQLSHFGQIALKDVKGNPTLLKHIMKPKKLYLFDFWASWCAPCIEEIPALKRISDLYPDVQVISLSIDSNEDAWLKASRKFEVSPSGNYLVSELTRNELLENYNIKDIPRFMLFDSKGKCITSNGPRPSDEQFEGFLRQLLSQ